MKTENQNPAALEAALAFADLKVRATADEMIKHLDGREYVWEAALRILAAQVRADAARKLDEDDLAKRISHRIIMYQSLMASPMMNQYSIEDIVKEELNK